MFHQTRRWTFRFCIRFFHPKIRKIISLRMYVLLTTAFLNALAPTSRPCGCGRGGCQSSKIGALDHWTWNNKTTWISWARARFVLVPCLFGNPKFEKDTSLYYIQLYRFTLCLIIQLYELGTYTMSFKSFKCCTPFLWGLVCVCWS